MTTWKDPKGQRLKLGGLYWVLKEDLKPVMVKRMENCWIDETGHNITDVIQYAENNPPPLPGESCCDCLGRVQPVVDAVKKWLCDCYKDDIEATEEFTNALKTLEQDAK